MLDKAFNDAEPVTKPKGQDTSGNVVRGTLSSNDEAWKPLEEYEASKLASHKPYCAHPRGTWCACVKFKSPSKITPPSSTTEQIQTEAVKCRICDGIIDHPDYCPPPHDAHGVCLIEEGHYIEGAIQGGE